MNNHRFGVLSFDEWPGFWKANPTDLDVTGQEYEEFYRNLDRSLREQYANYPTEFYVRGDCYGDRSLDIEIVNPDVLTASLLRDLQNRLKAEGANLWRIRIPTYLEPNQVIVVYPSGICVPGNSSGDLKQDIELITSQLIKKEGN